MVYLCNEYYSAFRKSEIIKFTSKMDRDGNSHCEYGNHRKTDVACFISSMQLVFNIQIHVFHLEYSEKSGNS